MSGPGVEAHRLRIVGLSAGQFVASRRPRLTWRSDGHAEVPTRAEVELSLAGERSVVGIDGPPRLLTDWPFDDLPSRARGTLRVRTGSTSGWSGWSTPLEFETTLLAARDWVADLIEPMTLGRIGEPAPTFWSEFDVGEVARARLYVTAHGVYDARLNGTRAGHDQLAPGWTTYDARLRFQTYDVTDLLRSGEANLIEVTVGNGWYRGRLGWSGARAHYGDALGTIAQLEIERLDGTVQTVATGRDWKVGEAQVVADDLYDGETVDLRMPPPASESVRVGDDVRALLVAAESPPIRVLERKAPLAVTSTIGEGILIDFGQNFTGWVELRVDGQRGQRIRVRHAEILVDGRLGTETLRSAEATDTYVLGGAGVQTLAPRFTFHGFRFAEISGMPIEQLHSVHGVVIGSELRRTGWFESSDERLNRLHENIVQSARSNFVDIPMDCPQRDERLGWTGDLQLFAPAATFLFDAAAMLDGWLADLRAEQHPDGSVPSTVPDILRDWIAPGNARTAGFSDAAVLVPDALYRAYGDDEAVRRQWQSAHAWIKRAVAEAGEDGVWSGGFQWGDWLDPSAPADDPSASTTPVDLVATAMLARTITVGIALARVVAPEDVEDLERDRTRVVDALLRRFVTADGLVVGDTPSGYAMLLTLGVLDERRRAAAGERLIALVRARGFRASTGFLGTALILDALDSVGAGHIALRMLRTDRSPSWLAQVRLGATTMWERWDSLSDDGEVNDAGMTSFNHYALGAVADWMHRRVGGIAPAQPGYRTVRIAPLLSYGLDGATTRLDSAFGEIAVRWERRRARVEFDIVLPAGVDAIVEVTGAPAHLPSGRHRFDVSDPAPALPDLASASVGEILDDPRTGPALVDLAVRLGIASDVDDAYRRFAAYVDGTAAELIDQVAHPAFLAGGPFIRRTLERELEQLGARSDARTP